MAPPRVVSHVRTPDTGARRSNNLNGMSQDENEVVPLKNVSSAILKKLIQWATYHKDEMLIVIDDDRRTVSSWDAEFFNVDQATLFQIILVADYLDIKDLLDAAYCVLTSCPVDKDVDVNVNVDDDDNFTRRQDDGVLVVNAMS
ncbi:hypothetical protein HPB47_007730 [Ixodes persulcatus]|uniref:Uncharacterized protein n=1 Tax=Ixodes persulcatus TaxID=34615 RepID=A0AC60P6P3_IXOPE|nr:hypothetical protein HPB47_007730 [Ixodes persulcatus]